MLKNFNPLEDRMFQIINCDGQIVNSDYFPAVEHSQIVQAYKDMLFARIADQMTVGYQRQGRIFTYPPSSGQEAIHVAIAQVQKPEDWIVPAFRELALYLAKGASLKDIFLIFMGYEDGNSFPNAPKLLPTSVPIASQIPHAAGLGFAIKYKGLKEAVWAFVGDGGTSEGDFHEGLNFAAVWDAPVVFVVQNNQFAISTRKKNQTKSINYAVKALAYGMEGIKVDGNDYFAMLKIAEFARNYVIENSKPLLIEAFTYRMAAHTTSDDPKRYRDREEEIEWEKTDPLRRLKKYLLDNNLITEQEEQLWIEGFKKEVDRIFVEAENYGEYKLDDVFDFHYADMPDELKRQKMAYKNFLEWKKQMNFKNVEQ